MSTSADIQKAIQAKLSQPNSLSVAVPVIDRRVKERSKEIEEALARKGGLCLFVMPPLPTRLQRAAQHIFFSETEVRVRVIEQPAVNSLGVDAYDLVDDVMLCLHWSEFPAMLSHPLILAERPCDMVEDPTYRIIDVVFNAIYGLARTGRDFSDTNTTFDTTGNTFDQA